MKKMKRIFALILALCMAFTFFCMNGYAVEIPPALMPLSAEEGEDDLRYYCIFLDEGDTVSGNTITYANGYQLTISGAGDFEQEMLLPFICFFPKENTVLTFQLTIPEGIERNAMVVCGDDKFIFEPGAEQSFTHTVHWDPDYDSQMFYIEFDDGAGIVVDKVELNGVTLTLSQGKSPVFTGTVGDENAYNIFSQVWSDPDYEQSWSSFYDNDEDVCKPGMSYYYSAILVSEEGYRFGNVGDENKDITVTLNGKALDSKLYAFDRDMLIINEAVSQKFNTVTASGKTLTAKSKEQSFNLNAKAKDGAKLTYSSNSKNVTVDKNTGVVTVKKDWSGSAKITVTAAATKTYNKTWKTVTVKVDKAAQPMTVKKSTFTLKKKDVKKKAKKFKITVSKAQGKVTYSSKSKYLKVSSKGTVTVKKGTPKGSYKVIVKAAGNSAYQAGTKTVTVKVK